MPTPGTDDGQFVRISQVMSSTVAPSSSSTWGQFMACSAGLRLGSRAARSAVPGTAFSVLPSLLHWQGRNQVFDREIKCVGVMIHRLSLWLTASDHPYRRDEN